MATQITGTYGTGIGPTYTHVIKKLLDHAKPKMPLHQFVQKRFIPSNAGKTAQFTRLLHIAPVTAALTEGAADTPLKVYAQDFTVSVAEWGQAIACSTLLDDTFINPALIAHTKLLGINAGESMQLELQKTLWGETYNSTSGAPANVGCIGLTWFATADAGKRNVLSTADSTGTTTTYVANDLNTAPSYGDNDNQFLGGSIVFTNPQSPNYGFGRRIFDSTSTSPTVTWKSTVPVATGTLDGTNLVASLETARLCAFGSSETTLLQTAGTDIMATGALRQAVGMLRKESADPYSDPYFVCTVSPEQYHNLVSASSAGDFIDTHKYTNIGPLLTNEVGNIAGCRIVMDNKPYKLSAASPFNYSATGTLHVAFVLGADALGAAGLQGQLRLGETDTQVIIKRPGKTTTSDPLDKFGTAGWKTVFGRLSLNACHAVGIVTAPNAL